MKSGTIYNIHLASLYGLKSPFDVVPIDIQLLFCVGNSCCTVNILKNYLSSKYYYIHYIKSIQIDVAQGTPLMYVILQLHIYIFPSQLSRPILYNTIYTQEESNTSAT